MTAVLAYITRRGTTDGPFFRLASNQQPLTKQLFMSKVRQALRELGLPEHHFTGHSFRIGVATAAARAGIEDSVNSVSGTLEQLSVSHLHPYPERSSPVLVIDSSVVLQDQTNVCIVTSRRQIRDTHAYTTLGIIDQATTYPQCILYR